MSEALTVLQTAPDGPEVEAFVGRYLAALPGAIADSITSDAGETSVEFGVDVGGGKRLAVRRALLPEEHVTLPVLIAYRLPVYVRELLASPAPARSMRDLDAELMKAAVLVTKAKTAAWNGREAKATHDELYGQLNLVLTAVAGSQRSVRRLAELEEVSGAPAGGEVDALVVCPMVGEPVSVAMSCGRCLWRGAAVRSCSYPVAAGYLMVMRREARRLPGR